VIRVFSALYPRSWRARYGVELDALLADQRPTPAAVVDLLLGALDAHLTGGGGVSSVVSRWRTPGALAFTVGGLIWFAGDAIELLDGGADQLGLLAIDAARLLVVFGELIVAFGVIDHARASRRGRALSLATATLAALGLLVGATAMVVLVLHTMGISNSALWYALEWSPGGAVVYYAAMAVFASLATMRNVLPRPPLAALAAASGGLLAWTLLPSPVNGIQAAHILFITLPLSWLLVGVVSLVFRPSRVEVALS
jgi:hypothetical protein